MPQKIVKANESHPLICHGKQVDTLTGEEWELYECAVPGCGYLKKERWQPTHKKVVLELGRDMLTAQDADEITQLRHEGKHLEADQRMARAPGHHMGNVRV